MQLLFRWQALPFFLGVFFYLLFKLSTLSIRLSDSNIYFVTAARLVEGDFLYKDVFFTNFPLHPYISAIYYLLLNGDLRLYYFTSALEVSVAASLIFLVLLQTKRSYLVATLSAFVYIFSVLVLTTTDHQSGVFIASVFGVLSYYFFTKKRFVLVGIFCALMLLVKAYFLPVAVTYGLYLILKKEYKDLLVYSFGGVVTGMTLLAPFVLFSYEDFLSQVFGYSLSRSGGIPKFEIGKFFVFRDFLLFGILIYNLIKIRTRPFWGIFSLSSFAFFFLYQDIYYLYLNFIAPFAALSFGYIYRDVGRLLKMQTYVLPTVFGVLFVWNMYVAYDNFHTLGRVDSIDEIVATVIQAEPSYVYGNNDIAPAVSHLSGVPLLGGVVDTNENIFNSGILDAEEMTDMALSKRTVLVLHSAYYPQLGVSQDVFSKIIVERRVQENCTLLRRFPVHAEGYTNNIAIFQCW